MDLFVIFLTGLTTGGLSCLAMQGGLLTSAIANQKEAEIDEAKAEKVPKSKKNLSLKSFDELDWLPVLMFMGAKLISHTLLGFLLGALGSVVSLSLEVSAAFQVFAALFMFATAMNLLDVHPIFRVLAFQPPKFLQRYIHHTSKSKALFAPAVLGFMTIFIPCGVTQAMEVLAINSGSPVYGALIMFAFVLGTSPLFTLIGVLTAKLSEAWNKIFSKVAAYTLIAMAIYSINGILLVAGSPVTLQKVIRPAVNFFSSEKSELNYSAAAINGVQKVKINVLNNGYSPNYIRVAAGTPVELTLESNEVYSCALSFVLREFGIRTFLDSTDRQVFNFVPTQKGKYTYTCSMGMYSGTLEVI